MEGNHNPVKIFLDNNTLYLLDQALVRIHLCLQRAFKAKGYEITAPQWMILTTLWEQEGLFQTEIAALANKDKPNITRILDVMEKNKLIFRLPSKEDRRKFKIFLTESGKNLKKKLVPIAAEIENTAFGNISQKELEVCKTMLKKINENVIRAL